jgi:hypothetical protein
LRLGLAYEEGVLIRKDAEKATQLYSGYRGGWMSYHRCSDITDALSI